MIFDLLNTSPMSIKIWPIHQFKLIHFQSRLCNDIWSFVKQRYDSNLLKFLFVIYFAYDHIQQPTIPQGLTEFIVNAYVDLRKESREFTSGICYNYYFISLFLFILYGFDWQVGNIKKPVRYFQFCVFHRQLPNWSCLTL